ncbi:hypothetical protein Nocox_22795 [Nonomuraea coxensis DSM 45129]|uniref:Lipoprotein n=1 Tax=Nonomuraea coxensis DSM 45129 TaxID=1122611 RepID=A0ABX8U667_9ACTN|nr:hypothetical protein [Nonomuraea coxensis]QYC42163.1 hypothetical protein Nocox_22795 [Nonomuraea coxensis DSM 45129]
MPPLQRLRTITATCLILIGLTLAATTFLTPDPALTETAHPTRHHQHPSGDEPLPQADTAQLLRAVACTDPKTQVDATELRQITCHTPTGRYTILTFATQDGTRAWLDEAQPYGGTYLTGDRWTIVADPHLLTTLHTRLGGHLEGHP